MEGSFAHDFGAIANSVPFCVSQNFTLTGAVVGTSGFVGVSAALPLGINVMPVKVPSTNTVTVEICNLSSTASYNPAALTYTVVLAGSAYR